MPDRQSDGVATCDNKAAAALVGPTILKECKIMLAVELLRFQECGVERASEALVGLDANDSRFHSLTFISTPAVCRNTNKQCEMKELRAGLFVRGPGKPITYACAEDACFSEAL